MTFSTVNRRDTTAAFVRSLLVAVGLLAIPCTAEVPPHVIDAQASLDQSRGLPVSTELDDFPLDPEAALDLPFGPEPGR